jgi:transketolase
MLLYSVLHLSGYDLTLDDIKAFRQWESRTPGHPEYGCAPGVETTTGPLGQGFANGVGMALAEAILAERFNKGGAALVDHYTYGIVGDGDLMEGISAEAASLAGHLSLNKLIYFFDSNRITIEGATSLTSSDDMKKRFESFGWSVIEVADGHDFASLEAALEKARADRSAPSLIIGHTHIAKGSPNKQDSESSHGAPLGDEEIALTKQGLGWPDEPFFVPGEVLDHFRARRDELQAVRGDWEASLKQAFADDPELASRWKAWQGRELPKNISGLLPDFADTDKVATRGASGKAIQALAPALENLVGGSADLAPSNKTMIGGSEAIRPDSFAGRNIHFGVREHAMGAVLNGMALHGGLIPYGGTFLVFADYMRPAIRIAALSGIPVIYVFTHDSVFVGEDGPTHQPVEHLASLRAIPNLAVIRPADARETSAAWAAALERTDGPTALILSRQGLPVLHGQELPPVHRGAYVVSREEVAEPALIIMATGSEVHAALEAKEMLGEDGKNVRIVSMPSWELFENQPAAYRDEVLPPGCGLRMAVEAGRSLGWDRYTAGPDRFVGVDRFGASAPYQVLAEKFGLNGETVARKARELMGGMA